MFCHYSDIRLKKKTEIDFDLLNRDCKINGLVWFENKIYVAFEHSTTLHAISGEEPFHRIPDEDIKIIKIPESHNSLMIERPYDLVACESSRSIFISGTTEHGTYAVWKIQFPDIKLSKIFECYLWIQRQTEEHASKLSTNALGELLALVNQ